MPWSLSSSTSQARLDSWLLSLKTARREAGLNELTAGDKREEGNIPKGPQRGHSNGRKRWRGTRSAPAPAHIQRDVCSASRRCSTNSRLCVS